MCKIRDLKFCSSSNPHNYFYFQLIPLLAFSDYTPASASTPAVPKFCIKSPLLRYHALGPDASIYGLQLLLKDKFYHVIDDNPPRQMLLFTYRWLLVFSCKQYLPSLVFKFDYSFFSTSLLEYNCFTMVC